MPIKNAFEDLATDSSIEHLTILLSAILAKLPFVDPTTAGARVAVQGTVPVSGSLSSAGTVSTVSNSTSIGGLLANADQYVQLQAPAASLRNRITIS